MCNPQVGHRAKVYTRQRVARWTIKEPRGVWASQASTHSLTLAGFLWAFFFDPRQEWQPMEDKMVEELFVRGCKLAVHHSMGEGKTTAGESSGREVQQQALAQEVQQLRKALQENCALQRRLAASAQGGRQGRVLERKLRKLTHEVGKLKALLTEREEIMWEKDRQPRELEDKSQWRDPRKVDAMIHPLALSNSPPCSGGERLILIGGISRLKVAYQEAIESMDAHFLHHTGECPRGRNEITYLVNRANIVLCAWDHNSHQACEAVKAICKALGKPCYFLSSSEVSQVRRLLEELVCSRVEGRRLTKQN